MPNYIAISKAAAGGGLTQDDITGVVQVVHTQTGALATGTLTIPQDDTIPQNTEGVEYMTLSITPTNINNELYIDVVFNGAPSIVGVFIVVALFQDAIVDALAAAVETENIVSSLHNTSFRHKMIAATVSPITFKVRAGLHAAGTLTFNGFAGARKFGGILASSITITEVKS